MSILVTGAGMVGSHVGKALASLGERPIFFDIDPSMQYLASVLDVTPDQVIAGDISDVDKLASTVRRESVHTVIHTAAMIGAPVSNDPQRGIDVNVHGSLSVAEAARRGGARRLIFCSSVAVYDLEALPPHALITENAATGPKNLYGATKLAAEVLLTHYGKLVDLSVFHIRIAGVFGRGLYRGGSWMGKVLNQMLLDVLQGKPSLLKPEWIGTQEYIYVKDVADAFARLCSQNRAASTIFNVGTGVLHSYSDLVAEINRLVPTAQIRVDQSAAPLVSYLNRTQAFDISRAKRELGFDPRFTFRTGLEDYMSELKSLSRPSAAGA